MTSNTTTMNSDSQQALGVPVSVERITAALKELWSANATHTRCSLINLVVYNQHEGRLAHNAALLEEITSDHACRALVIDALSSSDPDEETVKAWITAHCHLDQAGGKSMCSEQIAFQLRGDPSKLVPNTVFAHLDSDLPLAFWWQGDFTAAFEHHLTGRIDRLVIDSTSWKNPQREFATLQRARQRSGARFIVLDLVSTRLFSHRLALAACFDTPETLAGLERVEKITITHHMGQRFTARTFAAWMALKAGWKVKTSCSGGTLAMIASDKKPITLDFTESQVPSDCPGVSEIRLAGDDIETTVTLDSSGRYLQSTVVTGGHSPISCLTPVAACSEASLVSQRLRQPGNDALYFRIWNELLPCL